MKSVSSISLPIIWQVGGLDSEESVCHAGNLSWIHGLGTSLGGGLPIPVFLLGEFHGQRSLEGYRPRGCKEMTI